MRWIERYYMLPNDSGETLRRIEEAMEEHECSYTCLPFGWRLRANDSAAVFLRMAVDGLGVGGAEYPSDLFVPAHLRSECEMELATRCPSPAEWFEIIWVEFRTAEAQAHFADLLRRWASANGADGAIGF